MILNSQEDQVENTVPNLQVRGLEAVVGRRVVGIRVAHQLDQIFPLGFSGSQDGNFTVI